MAKLEKVGYGQLEINKLEARATGQMEAQCPLNAEVTTGENGMLLQVKNTKGAKSLGFSDGKGPVVLLACVEKVYNDLANGLKDFCIKPEDDFYPRAFYLNSGDTFTTNTVDLAEVSIENLNTPIYANAGTDGYIKLTATGTGALLQVDKITTMPDGQKALKFRVL